MRRSYEFRISGVLLFVAVFLGFAAEAEAQATFVGPVPYLSSADTPAGFYAGGVATALEDFED